MTVDTTKIKIAIGEHKFEAEGPTELVQCQLKAFSELVRSLHVPNSKTTGDGSAHWNGHDEGEEDLSPAALSGVMRVDGRVVFLTSSAPSPVEAALLVMLGQREMRSNLAATGQEIRDGLEKSGYPIARVYRFLANEVKEQLVVTVGAGRSMRYRLTTHGLRKARSLAKALASQEQVKDPCESRTAQNSFGTDLCG
jgi:hypothetical protein